MAINPKKHVVPHKHIIGDIVDGVTSNFTGGLIGGGIGGGGGYGGGILNIASEHEPIKKLELVNYIWGFNNGAWLPHLKTIPQGSDYIHLQDTKQKFGADLFLIVIDEQDGSYSPVVGVSTGLVVKKDITCGGYVGANQGLISLGSGMRNSFDPPGAWMTHSEKRKINFKGPARPPNPRVGWRWLDTTESTIENGMMQYAMYEYQQSGWVKLTYVWGGETHVLWSDFDNGYEFGPNRPSWGADRHGQYFITTGANNNGQLHYLNPRTGSWDTVGDVDDQNYGGFFDTFEIRRATYSPPLQTEMYAHLRCANITAHNTNPAADLMYGLGSPDRRWLGICADTVYADHIKDLKGDDFNFGTDWDGGTVHDNITILREESQLRLNATSGNPAIVFYNESVPKLYFAYSAANNHLYIQDSAAADPVLIFRPQGTLSIASDFYTAGKIILRSTNPIIDFAPPGLSAGQEYLVRLEGTTQNNAGWLNLYGHLKVAGDVNIAHAGIVNFNVNTTTANNNVVFNLQYLGNTEFMIGLTAMSVPDGYIYIATNNRRIIFSPGNSYTAFWGPVHFGPATNSVAGNAGQVLTSNGAGNAPTWQTPGSGPGGWNGGVVTGDNITVERVESQLRLNATSGSPALVFYRNGTQRFSLQYVANAAIADSYLSFVDHYTNLQVAMIKHDGNMGCQGDFQVGNRLLVSGSYGSAGQVLTSNGSSPPTWQTPGGGGGPGGWNGGVVTNNITVKYPNSSGNVPSVCVQSENSQACTFNLQIGSAVPGNVIGSFGYDSTNNRCVLNSTGRALRLTASTGGIWLEHDTIFNGAIDIRANGNQPVMNWCDYNGTIRGTISCYSNNFQIDSRGANSMTLASQRNTDIYLAPGTINGDSGGSVVLRLGRSLIPESSNTGQIGWQGRYFYEICSNRMFAKTAGNITGCERSDSGKEWPHKISDYVVALDKLAYQMTKTKYHTTYDLSTEHNIVCICGKSVSTPCPEHREVWNDRYTVEMDDVVFPAAYAALEHAVTLARLTQHNIELEERNNQLEERVGSLEQKLERLLQLVTASID